MECEQIRPALMNYLLEEASPEEAGHIQHHLEQCAACSEEAGRFRETLALVRRAEHMEEIPQRIRLVSEPAGRWQVLWLNPARLVFAGFSMACLAVALLAVSRATLSVGNGGMHIAFGAAPTVSAPVAPLAASRVVGQGAGLSRAEVQQLISEAVFASEAKQAGDTKQLMQTVSEQNEQQRMRDWRELTESLRPLEAAQVTIWKQQMQSDQYVSALMQQAGLRTTAQ